MNEKIIEELYIKYAGDSGGSWGVASDIINELIPRKDYSDDSSYYYHIHVIWQLIQEYIDSTYN